MVAIQTVLKIALNTEHMKHPFSGIEPKASRYSNWQKTGILAFAVASIFSLGIASCFLIITANLKQKKISHNQGYVQQSIISHNQGNDRQSIKAPRNVFHHNISRVFDEFLISKSSFNPSSSIFPKILTRGLFLIKAVYQDQKITKHLILDKESLKDIPKIFDKEVSNLKSTLGEELIINWSVLLQEENNLATVIHGIPGRTGCTSFLKKERAEKILTEFNASHALLEPFDLPPCPLAQLFGSKVSWNAV